MEDVIQILVFIVIVVSMIISKRKEVHANRPEKHVLQPDRPSVLPSDTEEELPEDFTDEQTEDLKAQVMAACTDAAITNTKNTEKDVEEHPVKLREKTRKEPKIRMKTRQEARSAFIYSEIFNRKYE